MQKIRVTSRKYDGRLRDACEAFLYAEDDEQLVVYAPVGTLSYDRRTQTCYQQIKAEVAGSQAAPAENGSSRSQEELQ